MKNRLMLLSDKLLARKRSIIETVIEQLKNVSQIEVRPRVVLRRKGTRTFEHSRHRSPINFGVNVGSPAEVMI